jgi:hypothetical protein
MTAVSAATPRLAGAAARRWQDALARRRTAMPADLAALGAELDALVPPARCQAA